MAGRDWRHDGDDLLLAAGGSLIETADPVRALAQAFIGDLEQPIKSMPWDIAGESAEAEAEGSRLFGLLDGDLDTYTAQQAQREIRRVARKSRYEDHISAVRLVDIEATGDALSFTIEASYYDTVLTLTANVGGTYE